jgi:adenylate cyclase
VTAADSIVKPLLDWLLDGARAAERPDQVLQKICDDLLANGVPLWRVGVFVRTLHPDILGRGFIWRPGQQVEVGTANFSILDSDDFLTSPLWTVFQTGNTVRHRIADGDGVEASPFLRNLQAEGGTDYIAIPLVFTDGSLHAASWSTRQPGGFTDEQLAILQALTLPLTRVAEIRALRRTAVNLLDTYVGNRAGERILAGQIRRGHTDTIDAAIWLSDMRGFTALSDSVPSEVVVDVLNRYFDCQVPPILEHGGEVLKFMGDGLLAIFPVDRDRNDTPEVCARALAAARKARTNIAELNQAGVQTASGQLRFAVALHVGQILYGNIGGSTRLDFTCIGPAVNLAARIEKIAGQLGRSIIASAEFARYQRDEWEPVGEFSVAGFAAKQSVFGLADDDVAQPAAAKIA